MHFSSCAQQVFSDTENGATAPLIIQAVFVLLDEKFFAISLSENTSRKRGVSSSARAMRIFTCCASIDATFTSARITCIVNKKLPYFCDFPVIVVKRNFFFLTKKLFFKHRSVTNATVNFFSGRIRLAVTRGAGE